MFNYHYMYSRVVYYWAMRNDVTQFVGALWPAERTPPVIAVRTTRSATVWSPPGGFAGARRNISIRRQLFEVIYTMLRI